MMRNRLKPDRRSVALLGVLLAAIIASGGALFYQRETTLASVTRQLQEKEKERDESARIASRLATTELAYKEDTDRLKFLEASLPSMAYVPTLLKQIEQLCKDTHNEVRSVRPEAAAPPPPRPAVRRTDPEAQQDDGNKKPDEKPKPADPYDRLTIQVSLTGGFKEYQDFLQQLTRFPKIVAVDRVQLRPHIDSQNPSGPPPLDVDMQLTAFILKDTASNGLPAGNSPGGTAPAGSPNGTATSALPPSAGSPQPAAAGAAAPAPSAAGLPDARRASADSPVLPAPVGRHTQPSWVPAGA